jgi:hypothetical protein
MANKCTSNLEQLDDLEPRNIADYFWNYFGTSKWGITKGKYQRYLSSKQRGDVFAHFHPDKFMSLARFSRSRDWKKIRKDISIVSTVLNQGKDGDFATKVDS